MRARIGDKEFECLSLRVGSWRAQYSETKVAGLHGTGIKSLGRKKREIKLALRLRAGSRRKLKQMRDELLAMADGSLHGVCVDVEGTFENVLVDECNAGEFAIGGTVSCLFEMKLIQVV